MMKRILAILINVVLIASVQAELKMPVIFSNNMVLQQNSDAALWGWAEPNEQIIIEAGWGETASATAGKDSKWSAKIKTINAGGPYDIAVKGQNGQLFFTNVMLGEVWICSGQSNMDMPMGGWANQPILNGPEEIAKADIPKIRIFQVDYTSAKEPQEDCAGKWSVCSPETIPYFSAVGYFFGRKLYDEINVPIGLIQTSWGGSSAEAWIRADILKGEPEFEPMMFKFNTLMKKWESDVQQAQAENKEDPMPPYAREVRISYLYNGMIKPLIPYNVKGAIWYQGETNASRGYQYGKLLPMLIHDWRHDWGNEMSFYIVQLANFFTHRPTEVVVPNNAVPTESYWAELREAQLSTITSVPNTGIAVTIDIGQANNIHPGDKKTVGERLAYWALAKDYGKKIVYSGPLYKSMTIEKTGKSILSFKKLPYSSKNVIRIKFDYAQSGLKVKGDKIKNIAIAGADKKFVWADAVIENDELVVWSDEVKEPAAVRYCWNIFPDATLYNKEGLPASPFRTDKWFANPDAQRN